MRPGCRALRATRLRVREDRPGFVERTSVCVQRTRAHRARDLSGISDLPSPRQTGTRRSKAGSRSRAPPSALRAPSPAAQGKDNLSLPLRSGGSCREATEGGVLDLPPPSPHRASQATAGERRACPSAGMREFAPARRRREAQGTSRATRARCGVGGGVFLVTFSSLEKKK